MPVARPGHAARTLALLAVAGVAGGFATHLIAAGPPPAVAPEVPEGLATARSLSEAFAYVADAVGPAVVAVRPYVERDGNRGSWMRPLQRGSGVIVSADGVLVTNRHVIEGADVVRVGLVDGRELEAELLGVDRDTDLAVLRVDAPDLVHAPLGAHRTPRIGEWVLAVGNPFGLGHSVTAGIVSGLGRSDLGVARYEDFIQTDAAINPGNSGGPLIGLDGTVLGINTAMGTEEEGSIGLGFATPARFVRRVVDDLVSNGAVRRGWLGISLRDLSRSELERRGGAGSHGVAVRYAVPDGPADAAGLRAGDLVQAIDGEAVSSSQELINALSLLHPGTRARLAVWRGDGALEVEVVLAERSAATD